MSKGGPLLSVAYNLTCLMRFLSLLYTLLRTSMNEAVDGTINQISSSSFEWWSSSVCSLRLHLFHSDLSGCVMNFSKTYMNEAFDGTINQISSGSFE